MDFGDLVRGGTEPTTGKSKVSSSLNPTLSSRPKTRAVDQDIYDTNIDLKNNRVKTNSRSGSSEYQDDVLNEKEIARISLNEWNEKNEGMGNVKRAPSRGRKSKDPTRKDHNLISGLSAYTQNMPNIVLNNNRKGSKSSANPSPRTGKEIRNLSQINDLRAAYGADILKPNSPGKVKSNSKSDQNSKFPAFDQSNRGSNLRKTSFETGSVASSVASSRAEVDTAAMERGREVSSNRSTVSSASEISSSPTRKTSKHNTLLKASFSSKHSDESMNNSDHGTHSVSPTDDDNQNRQNRVDGPSPEPVLIPVDDFLNQVIEEGAKKKKKRREKVDDGSSSTGASQTRGSEKSKHTEKVDQQQAVHTLVSLSFSDYTLGTGENAADDVFTELKDSELPEDTIEPVYDSLEEKPDSLNRGEIPQRKVRSMSEDPSSSRKRDSITTGEKLPIVTSPTTTDQAQANNDQQEETSPRPQSRKLYLGSDKNMRDSSSKAPPRSAGARYGAYSPVKGGVDTPPAEVGKANGSPRSKKQQFRKLSSHGDLADWVEDAGELRPPSRQSTAFPVHLSSEPGTAGNSPGATLSLALPSATNKVESTDPTTVTTEVDDVPTPSSRSSRMMAVNTEPKTVKRVGSGIEENRTPIPAGSSVSISNTTTDEAIYHVRPPSRQKVAAQHLFDNSPNNTMTIPNTSMHNNPSIESISLQSRKLSRSDTAGSLNTARRPDTTSEYYPHEGTSSTTLRTTTAAGRSRATTTRGQQNYDSDYNDDGFAELDPDDHYTPFPITINYSSDPIPVPGVTGNNTKVGIGGGNRLSVEDYPTDRSHEPLASVKNRKVAYGESPTRTSRSSGGGGGAGIQSSKIAGASPLRPKSVTTVPHHVGQKETATAAHPKYYYDAKPSATPASHYAQQPSHQPYHYDSHRQEELNNNANNNTLRSKSANNSSGNSHRLYHPIYATNNSEYSEGSQHPTPLHHHPSKPTKHQPPASSQGLRTRAWGDQPDPRNIPRAQNVFGMEADTGWTSPALLGNPYSSTTINDNFIIQDDDEMTILTEESDGYNNNISLPMDNSLSVQSFNIETSLDEDFLKLFAPGR